MTRLLTFLLLLLTLPFAAAAAPLLKPAVTVDAPVIRLGDLFDGIGERAQLAVAAAPPPGSKMVLNASWLAALAEAQHIDWKPLTRFDQAVVQRASRTIGADAIAERMLDAIAAHAPVDNAEIKLDLPSLHLDVAADQTAALAVDGLTFDPRSGRFSAVVSVPSSDAIVERLRVAGRLIRHADVPVLARAMAPGDALTKADFTLVPVRVDRLSQDTLLQLADLVGKTPRRALRPGEPIHASDVEVPVVVRRGGLVTIVLESASLRLTTEGKAMEDGAMGAVIRVANTKSNRVVDATVTGANAVLIGAAPVTQ